MKWNEQKYDGDSNYNKFLEPISPSAKHYHETFLLSSKFRQICLIFLKILAICLISLFAGLESQI